MNSLSIYNTLTRTMEELIPGGVRMERIEDYPPVKIYSCGPTVYSYAHIGNFRTFMFNDLLRRYLKYRGFKVDHTMNITDVDDKTIAGSQNEGTSLQDFTRKYTEIFFEDLTTLNIETFEHYPRATDCIPAMDEIITRLAEKQLTYEKDGSLYFSIAGFREYGRLSRLDVQGIKSGARYDADEYSKDDVRDFALWKASRPGEPSWSIAHAPSGRPGWHIECSAMVRSIYGSTIDIHTGGVDLVFPHHENEIAQSEAAYGEPFARYWMHSEHLFVEGAKMSKSAGNFYTLRDIIAKGYAPRAIRYLLISAHYRTKLNFTFDGLKAAQASLDKIDNFLARLSGVSGSGADAADECAALLADFTLAMDDDLNVSRALGRVFEFIHAINTRIDRGELGDAARVTDTLKRIDAVFGFIFAQTRVSADDAARIETLIAERNQAKKDRNFARADEIRDTLAAEGIILEDGKDGTRWKKKS